MYNRTVSSGIVSAVVALIVGSIFGTYGAWGLLLTQAESTAGRWVIAIAIGIFLAWVYSYFRNNFFITSTPSFRGVAYGLVIFLVTVILATMFEQMRGFAFKAPVGSTLFLTAIFHAIWGGVLSSVYEAGQESRVRIASRIRKQ